MKTILILEMHPRSRRPTDGNDNEIFALIESDRHRTTRKMSEILGINKPTVVKWLRQFGMISKVDEWVPHELRKENWLTKILLAIHSWSATKYISGCLQVMKRMFTCDEKDVYRWLCIIMFSIGHLRLRANMLLQPA